MTTEKIDRTSPAYWEACPHTDLGLIQQSMDHCIEQNKLPFLCEIWKVCARAKYLIETNKKLTKKK